MTNKILIGRTEWCALDDLNLPAIKAKIDTGAKTSAIHAFNIKSYYQNKKLFVKFDMHPIQGNSQTTISCRAQVIDTRYIMSSNGHKENRYVIHTTLTLGENSWLIELTLSNRDPLTYRLLLGREALGSRFLIDASVTNRQGKITKQLLRSLYR